jgi:ribose/xylose/arabinose/galactoside ABC-type transport system permease subunit
MKKELGLLGLLRSLASGKFLGIPMPFVLLILVGIVMWFVLHRSVYGRYLLAVGRNEEAARFAHDGSFPAAQAAAASTAEAMP